MRCPRCRNLHVYTGQSRMLELVPGRHIRQDYCPMCGWYWSPRIIGTPKPSSLKRGGDWVGRLMQHAPMEKTYAPGIYRSDEL